MNVPSFALPLMYRSTASGGGGADGACLAYQVQVCVKLANQSFSV